MPLLLLGGKGQFLAAENPYLWALMKFSVPSSTVILSLEAQELVTVSWSGLSLFLFHTPAFIHSPLSWTSQKMTRERKRRCKAYYYHLLFSFYEAVNTYQPDKIENISGNYQTPLLLHLISIFFSSSPPSSLLSVFSLRWLYPLRVYSLSSRSCTLKISLSALKGK